MAEIAILHKCDNGTETWVASKRVYHEQTPLWDHEAISRNKIVETRAKNLSKKHPDEFFRVKLAAKNNAEAHKIFKAGEETGLNSTTVVDALSKPRYVCALLNMEVDRDWLRNAIEPLQDRAWAGTFITGSKLAAETWINKYDAFSFTSVILAIGDPQTGEWHTALINGRSLPYWRDNAIEEWNRKRKFYNDEFAERLAPNATNTHILHNYHVDTKSHFAQMLYALANDFSMVAIDSHDMRALIGDFASQIKEMAIQLEESNS